MEDNTPKADRELLFQKKGMRLVNTLFILSMFFYKSGIICIAYVAWIVYLIGCMKRLGKGESKTLYILLTVLAAGMICVNLFFRFRG